MQQLVLVVAGCISPLDTGGCRMQDGRIDGSTHAMLPPMDAAIQRVPQPQDSAEPGRLRHGLASRKNRARFTAVSDLPCPSDLLSPAALAPSLPRAAGSPKTRGPGMSHCLGFHQFHAYLLPCAGQLACLPATFWPCISSISTVPHIRTGNGLGMTGSARLRCLAGSGVGFWPWCAGPLGHLVAGGESTRRGSPPYPTGLLHTWRSKRWDCLWIRRQARSQWGPT